MSHVTSHCALAITSIFSNLQLLSIATAQAAPRGSRSRRPRLALQPHTPHAHTPEVLGPRGSLYAHAPRTPTRSRRTVGQEGEREQLEGPSKRRAATQQEHPHAAHRLRGALVASSKCCGAHVAPTSRTTRLTAARRAAAGTPRSRPSCRGWRAPAGDRAGLSASLRASRPPARVLLRASATVTVSFSGKCLGSV